jgi:hypothetical protein
MMDAVLENEIVDLVLLHAVRTCLPARNLDLFPLQST